MNPKNKRLQHFAKDVEKPEETGDSVNNLTEQPPDEKPVSGEPRFKWPWT